MKAGLVLEGGGMRSMFTAAVLDTFLDAEINFDKIVSVSAGSLFGVNYLSRQKGRALRYSKRFSLDKNYFGLRPLLREGNIINTEYAYERVPKELDPFDNETYKKSGVPFYVALTNLATGEAEYVNIYDVFEQMDTLRATGSMPFLSHAVVLDGKEYLDGGVVDSIPFEWMLAQPDCDKVVVVLTREEAYRKKPFSWIAPYFYKYKYPLFAEKIVRRHEMYNEKVVKLMELEKEGKLFIIRPPDGINIGRLERDPAKLQAVYDYGIECAQARLDALKAYLSS